MTYHDLEHLVLAQGTFAATLEGLSEATNFLERFYSGRGGQEELRRDGMIALDEIGSNIVHYSGTASFSLAIAFDEKTDTGYLIISDSGKPYNPLDTKAPELDADFDERQMGGFGIFMVRQLMDGVYYSRENNRNILILAKKYGPSTICKKGK